MTEEIMLYLDEIQMQIRLLGHKMNPLAWKIVGFDLSMVATPQPQGHEATSPSTSQFLS
jgi:hypothetical protein